jgi:hypothetical protein
MNNFRPICVCLLGAGLVSPHTAAQNQPCPPGLSRPFAASTVFDIGRPPFAGCGLNIQQIACQQLSCNAGAQFTVTMSIEALCATYGGDGVRLGLVEGTYDLATDTCVLNTNGNALNAAGNHQFNYQLEPGRGRFCVFDRFDGSFNYTGVFFASRAQCGSPFGAPVQVQNIPGTDVGYRDPALGYLGGRLKLFFVSNVGTTTGVYVDDLDVSNLLAPRAAGTPVLVRASARGGIANSPTPITGPDGDVEGLWHADLLSAANDNDMLFACSLDPATPTAMTYDTPAWTNNGGVAGGRLLCGDGNLMWTRVGEARGAWLLGDEEAIGGTMDIFGGAWARNGNVVATLVYLSLGVGRTFTVPGIHGGLCLTVTFMPLLGTMTHDAAQMARLSFAVPNDVNLRGMQLAIQGVAVEPAAGVFTFTNNAWLRVRP